MKRHILFLILVSLGFVLSAGKQKIKIPGKKDVYVPTMDNNGKDLTLDGNVTISGNATFEGGVVGIGASGLAVSEQSVTGTTPSTGVLNTGKHYVFDLGAATGPSTVTLQAGAVDSTIRISIVNNTGGHSLNIDADGTEKILYGNTQYDDANLSNTTGWVHLVWDSIRGYWIADDNATFFTGNFNGNLSVSGDFVSTGSMSIPSVWKDFSDIWDTKAIELPLGWIGTGGSYALTIASNGYRNTSSGFTYMDINGITNTASAIDLFPNGNIYFKSGTASGTSLPYVMAATPSGIFTYQTLNANAGIKPSAASNTLDHYEEMTFSGTDISNTTSSSYDGKATRIGNVVTVTLKYSFTKSGTSTANIPSGTLTANFQPVTTQVVNVHHKIDSSWYINTMYVAPGGYINIYKSFDATTINDGSVVTSGFASNQYVSFSYIVDL